MLPPFCAQDMGAARTIRIFGKSIQFFIDNRAVFKDSATHLPTLRFGYAPRVFL
jgi:hypothetical protein